MNQPLQRGETRRYGKLIFVAGAQDLSCTHTRRDYLSAYLEKARHYRDALNCDSFTDIVSNKDMFNIEHASYLFLESPEAEKQELRTTDEEVLVSLASSRLGYHATKSRRAE